MRPRSLTPPPRGDGTGRDAAGRPGQGDASTGVVRGGGRRGAGEDAAEGGSWSRGHPHPLARREAIAPSSLLPSERPGFPAM